MYVADTLNSAVRKITSAGVISTVAGQGVSGYTDGPLSNALFGSLKNVILKSTNNMFIIDSGNNVIRKITNYFEPTANVETLFAYTIGNNTASHSAYKYPANSAIGADVNGNIYVADYDNSLIQKVSANGIVTTLAGTSGVAAVSTRALPGTLFHPVGLYVDPAGAFLYALENNHLVKIMLP